MIPFLALKALIPWRYVAIGMAALAFFSLVLGGYAYIKRLQTRVVQLEIALAGEQQAHQITRDTLDQFKRSVALSQIKIDELHRKNVKDQDSWISTLKLIDELDDCPPLPAPDPTKPTAKSAHDQVDRLNRTNSDVNRMLERIGR